ncbi:hypothetical protein [Listeria booriae]|uniref:PrgI family protein n=1 Tax=Listeria booriae TaxID=1552123 RepID=A0A842AKG2_9LIST|nr:hypothetical protein [Listeria booriae]MBC1212442.1 hypothetical protein [Listeria booriae]MBC1309317.1 hypothetical protein [Listeria booriae]MBC1403117.1 hypothetical protein [Listeria booriae]MBC1617927.1 hypothetical protein [Listeria booriae]MBC1920312.1 hypothetical protein [Listeria booriae]
MSEAQGRKSLRVPTEIDVDNKWETLTVKDGFTIIISIAVGFVLSFLFPSMIRIAVVVLFAVGTWLAVYPNKDVHGKKNYHVMLTILRKRRVVWQKEDRDEIAERMTTEHEI